MFGFENTLKVYSYSSNETLVQAHFNLQYYFQAIIKVKAFIIKVQYISSWEKENTGVAQLCPLFSQVVRHECQWLLLVYVTPADGQKKSQVLLYARRKSIVIVTQD